MRVLALSPWSRRSYPEFRTSLPPPLTASTQSRETPCCMSVPGTKEFFHPRTGWIRSCLSFANGRRGVMKVPPGEDLRNRLLSGVPLGKSVCCPPLKTNARPLPGWTSSWHYGHLPHPAVVTGLGPKGTGTFISAARPLEHAL